MRNRLLPIITLGEARVGVTRTFDLGANEENGHAGIIYYAHANYPSHNHVRERCRSTNIA